MPLDDPWGDAWGEAWNGYWGGAIAPAPEPPAQPHVLDFPRAAPDFAGRDGETVIVVGGDPWDGAWGETWGEAWRVLASEEAGEPVPPILDFARARPFDIDLSFRRTRGINDPV